MLVTIFIPHSSDPANQNERYKSLPWNAKPVKEVFLNYAEFDTKS